MLSIYLSDKLVEPIFVMAVNVRVDPLNFGHHVKFVKLARQIRASGELFRPMDVIRRSMPKAGSGDTRDIQIGLDLMSPNSERKFVGFP